MERASDAHGKAVERRIDATWAQTENAQAQLAAGIDAAHQDLTRVILLGLLGTAVTTAGLCLATILLVT